LETKCNSNFRDLMFILPDIIVSDDGAAALEDGAAVLDDDAAVLDDDVTVLDDDVAV
jgi:hypothetical protein